MDSDGDKTFYTVTMARVYADQGRYAQSARIYRYLLDQTPDREDLRQALNEVRAHLPDVPVEWPSVSGTIERWVRLLLRRNTLRCLERVAGQASSVNPQRFISSTRRFEGSHDS